MTAPVTGVLVFAFVLAGVFISGLALAGVARDADWCVIARGLIRGKCDRISRRFRRIRL